MEHRDPPVPLVLISVYQWVTAAMSLAGIALLAILPYGAPGVAPMPLVEPVAFAVVAAISLLWAAAHGIVGWGIWKLRPWSRSGVIALAIPELCLVPLGTVIGTLILWYLFTPEGRAAFRAQENP